MLVEANLFLAIKLQSELIVRTIPVLQVVSIKKKIKVEIESKILLLATNT